jgi:hypothetical protein
MNSFSLESSFVRRQPVSAQHKLRTVIAFVAIWTISLLVLLFGLPLIIYQALTRDSDAK